MKKSQKVVIEEFVEQLGLIAQADGLPRIAGRILGLMVIHAGPFSFSELGVLLKVSRGSISTNTRVLENLGVIERTTRPGDRQDYFRLHENPYVELMRGLQNRMKKARHVVADTREKLPVSDKAMQKRLADLGDFYQQFIDTTESMTNNEDANR